ncbi:unnamed protein product [Cuscuta epithymum]|uniref:C2H2-type domain-containing protein n=1 Tax=Cuscuta epithymum TaxID=186058 RepID=A0AAV0EKP3_9ASTE|nr:unnamed protein product [Cuscuta epithymum]
MPGNFSRMEDHHHHQDLKFVCKQCNKRYPCGKSLGGHMRSHVTPNSADFVVEEKQKLHHQQSSRFGLRENPKKTWRAVVGSTPTPTTTLSQSQENACKQCGKVFQSLKALCGHMACHSDKDKGGGGVNKDDDDKSWSEIESDSDSDEAVAEEEQIPLSDRSANLNKYKKIVIKYNNNNTNSVGGSSSVSEIDSQEQEEIAKCLMMLSKDSGNWNAGSLVVNNSSIVEFSDNNSVVLETTKSSSIDMKSCKKDSVFINPKKIEEDRKKLKSSIDNMVEFESHSSDSGYFLGENKDESDISVNRIKGYYYDDSAFTSRKYGKQKRPNNDTSYDPEIETRGAYKKGKIVSSGANNKKYECLNCKKSFGSYQALGGHRPCYKKTNADRESGYGTGENSLEGDDEARECLAGGGKRGNAVKGYSSIEKNGIKFKKGKGHECPFCHRVFKSGQALGGHKRSHFIGGSSHVMNGSNQTSASASKPEEVEEEAPDLLDLNLPAPVEDDEDEQLMSW